MININRYTLFSAGIYTVLSTNVYAGEIKTTVSKIMDDSFVIINNPVSNINEKLQINTNVLHSAESSNYHMMIKKRIKENSDIEKIENTLDIMYEYMKLGKDVSYEEQVVMSIYSRNYHSEDINFMLGKFLIDTNGSGEHIRNYFLRALNNGNKHRTEIENIYFSKIFNYIKEDVKNLDDPFIASLILDFIPYMTKDCIINSGLSNSIIDNLLLIKEYKHNLAIIERSSKGLLSSEFIEEHVMDIYRSNQNNIDINFIMGEYMLRHGLFPEKMRECFLKALKGGNKYSEVIHKIFLSKIVDIIKDNKDAIHNESYGDTITTFMPYIKDDLEKIGIVVAEK